MRYPADDTVRNPLPRYEGPCISWLTSRESRISRRHPAHVSLVHVLAHARLTARANPREGGCAVYPSGDSHFDRACGKRLLDFAPGILIYVCLNGASDVSSGENRSARQEAGIAVLNPAAGIFCLSVLSVRVFRMQLVQIQMEG